MMWSFFPFLSILTSICKLPKSPFILPILLRWFNFVVASVAFDINSLRKISWSLYKNFFINGKMFSTETFILPLLIIYFICFKVSKKIPLLNSVTK